MKIELEKLLLATARVVDEECAPKVMSLLKDPQTRLVDGAPTNEKVHDLLSTLKVRKATSARTGKHIFGLDRMAARVSQMDGATVVSGYGFISPSAAGNVYVLGETDEALGAIIVDR